MRSLMLLGVLVVGLLFVSLAQAQIPDEDWGYVTVRDKAHMFWWLYGTTSVGKNSRSDVPLVMWLQGGPGGSSTGFGNFAEIGPLDIYLNPRKSSWVTEANLLFVDNPVGTGYSYVEKGGNYTKTENDIASDLLVLFQAFMKKYPSFSNTPFYIFSESYGGKMAASFALALNNAIQNNQIACKFGGVAMGDSWIEPIAFVDAWAPYLLSLSLIDSQGAAQIQDLAKQVRDALNNQQYDLATQLWSQTEDVVESVSFNVDFYNVNQHDSSSSGMRMKKRLGLVSPKDPDADLDKLMNGQIKQKLGIPASVQWGGQAGDVFSNLGTDFMQSVVSTVDSLLAAGVKTIVYSGNDDLICCTPGTLTWVSHLKWKGLSGWQQASRYPLKTSASPVAGAVKSFNNFYFYYIFGAGHMVPSDQPETALVLLQSVLNS